MLFQTTFLSLWYWGFSVLFWGVICNYTFGVPNELLVRAHRSEEDAAIFDRYARRNLALFGARIRSRGPLVAGLAAFLVAALLTAAIRSGHELLTGLAVIIGPLSGLWFWGGVQIRRLDDAQPSPEALRRKFMRQRLVTGCVAGLSIVAAYSVATLRHGPEWTGALLRGLWG